MDPKRLARRFALASACCTLTTACTQLRPPHGLSLDPSLAGTYRIEICRGPCGSAPADSSLAAGHLVMESRPYRASSLPPRARALVEREMLLRIHVPDDVMDPNACFVFTRARENDGYAGIDKVGFTLAEATEGSLFVRFFQSPDAGYHVVLRRNGDGWQGRGQSYGVGDAAVSVPDDSVVARRIGRPDRGLCVRAAEEPSLDP
jgi:hypothetical protein